VERGSRRRRCGNVGIAVFAISKGRWEAWETGVWFSTVSTAPAFPQRSPVLEAVSPWLPAPRQQGQFGLLHLTPSFGIALAFGQLPQALLGDSGLQVLGPVFQRGQLLERRPVILVGIPAPAAPARVRLQGGKSTGAVKVQIGVHPRGIELLKL